jgi:hypothetical protein
MIAAMRGTAHSMGLGLLFVAGMSGCGSTSDGPSAAKATLPPPVFARTVNLSPVTGKVLVELPATSRFVALAGARQVPVGTFVDASAGVVRLTAATGTSGDFDAGDFQAGTFEVRQDPAEPGLTELRIRNDETVRKACGRSSKRQFGLLLGDAKGRFRTRGRFSQATVRGTQWGVRNRCDGTLTIVRRGVVVVKDFALHKNVVVRAGHSFLARAP